MVAFESCGVRTASCSSHCLCLQAAALLIDPQSFRVHKFDDVLVATVMQAFTLLDSIARMVLHAVCRSCHVRLHQATLDTLLDETPLTDGVTASSVLQACFQQPCHATETPQLQM